jgi:DNA-binding CsgD family transcriptional regulator
MAAKRTRVLHLRIHTLRMLGLCQPGSDGIETLRAADLALRGGAIALSQRARTELAATGARPRRELLLSGPASLTPSERRIAELAAAGKGNREIVQGLFVTAKTVEYHLCNVYRKLGIERRRELADALTS